MDVKNLDVKTKNVEKLKRKAENARKKSDRMLNYSGASFIMSGVSLVPLLGCAISPAHTVGEAIPMVAGFAVAGALFLVDSTRLAIKEERLEEKVKELQKTK